MLGRHAMHGGTCMAHADEKAVFSNDFFMPSACRTVPFELTRVFILKYPASEQSENNAI